MYRITKRGLAILEGGPPDWPAATHGPDAASRPGRKTDPVHFDPTAVQDERERTLVEITKRRGQVWFRRKLLIAYESRCAITGCDCVDTLEAAHIYPYRGTQTNSVTNGILLRADIHTLFDLYLIGIRPSDQRIVLAPKLKESSYKRLEGKQMRSLRYATDRPNKKALKLRYKEFEGRV